VALWYFPEQKLPLVLSGKAVGTRLQLTIDVNRNMKDSPQATLFLDVDDIDAKREATIALNGKVLPIPDSLLGEGAGFEAHLPLPAGLVKQGANIIEFTFADNLSGATKGYGIVKAAITLQVDEDNADPSRRREIQPPPDGVRHDQLRSKIAQLKYSSAKRKQIGHRGLSFGAIAQHRRCGMITAVCSYRFEGKSWQLKFLGLINPMADTWTPIDHEPMFGRQPGLTITARGVLLLTTSRRGKLHVHESTDDGKTWDNVWTSGDQWQTLPRNSITLKGKPALLMSTGTFFNPAAPPGRAWIVTGDNFEQRQNVQAWNNPEPMFDQSSAIVLKDGTILATGNVTACTLPRSMPWTYRSRISPADHIPDHTILSRSTNGGKTWTTTRLTDTGQVHAHLAALQDGRILCTYAQQVRPFGIFAMFSSDSGKSWQRDRPVQLASSLDATCGWPTSLQTSEWDIVTSYTTRAYRGHTSSTTLDHITEWVQWQAR
jgi:hypothetical protein